MCECFICSSAVVVVALFFSGWLEGILLKCWSQLWCRIKTEKGGGEGRRHSDKRMCRESEVWRRRERFASPVWQSRCSVPVWALCPRGGSVWLALTVTQKKMHRQQRETERHKCVYGGCLRLTSKGGLVCICMWSGQVVIQQERRMRGDSQQHYYWSSIYKQRWLDLQLKLYPVLTNDLMKQVSQFI